MKGEKDQFVTKEEVERKKLEVFVRQAITKISQELAGSVTAEVGKMMAEDLAHELFPLRLTQHVIGERTADIELPDGAWQWLKLALAPRWLLARYPIRVRKMNIVRIYPEIQPLRGRSSYEVLMPDVRKMNGEEGKGAA